MEDLRSTTVVEDPVQRRDLILLERAREGDLDAFNDLVRLYQDQLFALVVRMVPDRDQAVRRASRRRSSRRSATSTSFRGGSVKSWLNRIAVNAAMDIQRARKRRPVQPYPELEDESWQPPAGDDADPERTAVLTERTRALSQALALDHRRPARRDRAVRRRGLRLPRDRRDDRRLARARSSRGSIAVGSPSARCSRAGWSCSVADPAARRPAGPPSHADHDPELIVALLDRDLADADRAVAETLVRDLRRVRRAPRRPAGRWPRRAASSPTPRRPRDFALTPEAAAALRPETAGEPVAAVEPV